MVLIPILSFLASGVLIEQNKVNNWFPLPPDLYVRKGDFLSFIGDPLIVVKLLITLCLAFILFMLFSFISFAINSMFGRSRYGAYDLPPLTLPKGVHKSKAR